MRYVSALFLGFALCLSSVSAQAEVLVYDNPFAAPFHVTDANRAGAALMGLTTVDLSAFETITSITLTLNYSGAGAALNDNWFLKPMGLNIPFSFSNSATPDLHLGAGGMPNTFTFAADSFFGASDWLPIFGPSYKEQVQAAWAPLWAEIQNSKTFFFTFALENALRNGSFDLSGFTLTVNGGLRNVVPVPAAVWLLGSGVAGLLALRRRGSKA